jgi:hypothetical protein
VGRIWRKFDLKTHLAGGFKLSTGPLFVEKVVDVVGLYHNRGEGRGALRAAGLLAPWVFSVLTAAWPRRVAAPRGALLQPKGSGAVPFPPPPGLHG